MEPLQLAALLWAIGDQPPQGLPDLAVDALVRGLDSLSLRELAGVPADDFWRIKGLFESVVGELGFELLDEQAALWQLARHKAGEIVARTVTPSRGAHWIWSELHHRLRREGDLRVFIGLASEWDDHPRHRDEIEASIIAAAQRLLDQPEPRRWLRIQGRQGLSAIADSATRAEVPPTALPISDDLARCLIEWAEVYDATFGPDQDGFGRKGNVVRFVDHGRSLAGRLQSELGDSWHVEYIPEPTRPRGQ